MSAENERPPAQGGDTLPEFPAVADQADSDVATASRRVRRSRAVQQAGGSTREFRNTALEIVLEFIDGILP